MGGTMALPGEDSWGGRCRCRWCDGVQRFEIMSVSPIGGKALRLGGTNLREIE